MKLKSIKQVGTLLIVLTSFYSKAQEFSNKNLQAIVNAEREFSKMAREQSTRNAFLHFLTNESVTFGEGPIIGKEKYQDQKPNDSQLSWLPDFVDVSDAGDLGFDSGPWEFRNKRIDTDPIAFGHFISVWKKQPNGKWRNIVDIGIEHPKTERKIDRVETSYVQKEKSTAKASENIDLLHIEKKFIADVKQTNGSAYLDYLSIAPRFYRSGRMPIVNLDSVKNLLKESEPVKYSPISSVVSASGDVGYVYGIGERDKKAADGTRSTQKINYLRIWKKENQEWRIALEVVSNW